MKSQSMLIVLLCAALVSVLTGCRLASGELAAATEEALPEASVEAAQPVDGNTSDTETLTEATDEPPSQQTENTTTAPIVVADNSNTQPSTDNTVAITCQPRTDWQLYIVVSGDTLFNIASRANTTTQALIEANCLTNPDVIEAGQQLRVPQKPAAPNPPVGIPSSPPNGQGPCINCPGDGVYAQPGFKAVWWDQADMIFEVPQDWIVQFSGDAGVSSIKIYNYGEDFGGTAPPKFNPNAVDITLTGDIFAPQNLQEYVDADLQRFREQYMMQIEQTGTAVIGGQQAIRLDGVSGSGHVLTYYYMRARRAGVNIMVEGNPQQIATVLASFR